MRRSLGGRDGQSCADNRLQEALILVPVLDRYLLVVYCSLAVVSGAGTWRASLLARGLRGWLVFGQVQRAGGVMPRGG